MVSRAFQKGLSSFETTCIEEGERGRPLILALAIENRTKEQEPSI